MKIFIYKPNKKNVRMIYNANTMCFILETLSRGYIKNQKCHTDGQFRFKKDNKVALCE